MAEPLNPEQRIVDDVLALPVAQLGALREALARHFGEPPPSAAGAREPRRTPSGTGGVGAAVDPAEWRDWDWRL